MKSMKTQWIRGLACALLCGALVSSAAADGVLQNNEWSLIELDAVPEAPELPDLPVQLILDDDSLEGAFGVSDGMVAARQFMWFNQFSLDSLGQINLRQLWVLFPPGANMAVGNDVQLAVYHDGDDDPSTGAALLATYDVTIQVVDGVTFSVYELAEPLALPPNGYALVGAIPRFIESDVTSLTNPAAIDTTTSLGQSWLAVWSGDPPADPELPSDLFLDRIDTVTSTGGNWAIRAFGGDRPVVEIPTLGSAAFGVLAGLLLLAGWGVLRRR